MTISLIPHKRSANPVPHSLEIAILFKDFIHYWMGWQVHLDEDPGVISDGKEWQIAIRGPFQATLAVRCNVPLMGALWENQLAFGRDFPTAESALREMAVLFATHLIRTFWKDRFMELEPLIARPTVSREKPSSFQCHTYCSFLLNGEPLELRFWMDPGQTRIHEAAS